MFSIIIYRILENLTIDDYGGGDTFFCLYDNIRKNKQRFP